MKKLQHSKFIAKALTVSVLIIGFCVMLFPTSPMLQAQTNNPGGSETDLHNMRTNDEVTSGTLLLQKKNELSLADGIITFDILKETTLMSKPPPLYNEGLENLDGKEVTLRGFMTPYDSLTRFEHFMVFPYATGCQFCAVPSPKEVVFIRLVDEQKDQKFIPDPIEVKGTLSLWKEGRDKEDEAHRSFLYVMNNATVKAIKN